MSPALTASAKRCDVHAIDESFELWPAGKTVSASDDSLGVIEGEGGGIGIAFEPIYL